MKILVTCCELCDELCYAVLCCAVMAAEWGVFESGSRRVDDHSSMMIAAVKYYETIDRD